jgi:hypothetical protein
MFGMAGGGNLPHSSHNLHVPPLHFPVVPIFVFIARRPVPGENCSSCSDSINNNFTCQEEEEGTLETEGIPM